MASVNISEFHDLCRICGNKTSVLMGLHIFEREGELRQIHKKIMECLPIKVLNNDILPKMVCEECVYKLDLLYDFRANSLKTDTVLNGLLKEIPSNQNLDKDLKSTVEISQLNLSNTIDKTSTSDTKLGIVANPQPQPPATTRLIISNVTTVSSNFKKEPDILIKVEEMAAGGSCIDSASRANNANSEEANCSELDDSVSCCDESEDEFTAATSQTPTDALVIDMKQTPEKITSTPSFAQSDEFLVQDQQTSVQSDEFLVPDQQTSAWFFCNICGKTYSSKEEFNVHYEVHWNKCHDCGAIFTDEEALLAHRKQVHIAPPTQTTTTTTLDNNGVGAGAGAKVEGNEEKAEEEGSKKPAAGGGGGI
ncbi:uncharacterized protein LOC111058644 [Nilaparvata lugens]|uniref:uncharacterized protein LOC111058644 n=1 Tax=Nilaparvata lugens TaxID=108931 RepID=UPI00193CE0F6|nr:uncharacterized protein LOC111058644 [Nilaparvata lugens]